MLRVVILVAVTALVGAGATVTPGIRIGENAVLGAGAAFVRNKYYEEFDDGHSGIDYRLDVSLPLLYEAISG